MHNVEAKVDRGPKKRHLSPGAPTIALPSESGSGEDGEGEGVDADVVAREAKRTRSGKKEQEEGHGDRERIDAAAAAAAHLAGDQRRAAAQLAAEEAAEQRRAAMTLQAGHRSRTEQRRFGEARSMSIKIQSAQRGKKVSCLLILLQTTRVIYTYRGQRALAAASAFCV